MNSSSTSPGFSHLESLSFGLMNFADQTLAANDAPAMTNTTADVLLQAAAKHRFVRAIQALRRR